MRKLRKPSGPLKAKLQGAVRKGRRETIYKMLGRQHDGKVPCFECSHHVTEEEATLEHIVEQSDAATHCRNTVAAAPPMTTGTPTC